MKFRKPSVKYRDNPTIGSNIFLCGLHRSGTSIIENYIYDYFETLALRARVPENEGQHLQDVYPAAKLHGGPGRFAFNPVMSPKPLSVFDATKARERVLECWGPYVVGQGSLLIEKSPPNITKIPYLRSLFPGAVFLIITRDPRAVAGATQKWSKNSLEELMMHWNVAYSIALRAIESDCFILRYEDFCRNPHQSIVDCGLAAVLQTRQNPNDANPRLQRIENSNDKYMSLHDCRYYGKGAWEDFGYEI